ncbi:hypothetical protein Tco_1575726, partial [Tanacetum coccineum]
ELKLMHVRMFPEESDKIEKYVDGLHDMIHRSVMASKPKTMHDAIEFATELMDKKISTFAECQAYNKRKFDDTSRNNQNQQQQNKSVLLNATSEIKLAIWPMTIRVLQMPILLTTKGALGQLGMAMLQQKCMRWAMQGQTHIPTLLRGNETLIVRGDESDQGNETRLNIISCTKTQKYMLKGCHIFLAHDTTKETEDMSEEKRLEDVPIVRDFPEVFPEDLPARAPYRLALSKMKELSDQLQEIFDKGFIRPSSSP